MMKWSRRRQLGASSRTSDKHSLSSLSVSSSSTDIGGPNIVFTQAVSVAILYFCTNLSFERYTQVFNEFHMGEGYWRHDIPLRADVAVSVSVSSSLLWSLTPILKSLHWLKINECIEYKLLSLTTYKVLTTSQPDYLHNLISVQSSEPAPHLLSP